MYTQKPLKKSPINQRLLLPKKDGNPKLAAFKQSIHLVSC